MEMHQYFSKYKKLIDLTNDKYSSAYRAKKDHLFYIENAFNDAFSRLEQIYPNDFNLILKELEKTIEKNKIVVFCLNDEMTPIIRPDAIYITLYDLADSTNCNIENKSRGSDYGD